MFKKILIASLIATSFASVPLISSAEQRAGHWVRERRGSHWVPEQWVERNGRWPLVAGHWDRGGRGRGGPGMRDRDGDGVPNRFDARPNNPNRS